MLEIHKITTKNTPAIKIMVYLSKVFFLTHAVSCILICGAAFGLYTVRLNIIMYVCVSWHRDVRNTQTKNRVLPCLLTLLHYRKSGSSVNSRYVTLYGSRRQIVYRLLYAPINAMPHFPLPGRPTQGRGKLTLSNDNSLMPLPHTGGSFLCQSPVYVNLLTMGQIFMYIYGQILSNAPCTCPGRRGSGASHW